MTSRIDRAGLVAWMLRWLPPRTRGKARIARFLLGPEQRRTNVSLTDRHGCTYVAPSLMEPVAFHLLINGCYEPEAADFILGHLPPGGTFVDVGANIGCFTFPAARKVGPGGRVLAIEASSQIVSYLQENARLNGLENVTIRHCAATDGGQEAVPFYDAPAEQFGMGSRAPQFHAAPVMVPAQSLDQFLAAEGVSRADVLKVDVEGFEADVFLGGKNLLLSERPPIILFEFCDWAEARTRDRQPGKAQQLLRDYGYDLFRLCGDRLQPTEVVVSGCETMVAVKQASASARGQV